MGVFEVGCAHLVKMRPGFELSEWRKSQIENASACDNKYMRALKNQRVDLKQRRDDEFKVINSAEEWEKVISN